MRRAGSVGDVIATLFIIGIFTFIFAIRERDPSKTLNRGDEIQIKETGARGRVVDYDSLTVKLRLDNGPGAVPRYSEVSFFKDEVTKLAEKKP